MKKLFELNEISHNLIQIYGTVNGFARKVEEFNSSAYIFDVSFIKNRKLIRVYNETIRTLTTKKKLKEHLEKIYYEE